MSNSNSDIANTWNLESESYRFDDFRKPDFAANFFFLTKLLGDVKNKKILEVGSGSGLSSAYLAIKGANVSLLDISHKSLNFSKKYFSSMNLVGRFYLQDAFKMNFSPESFDYVWNAGVIEHFSDKDKIQMIKKMWKLVKPGGKLLITAPNSKDFPFMVAKKILQLRNKWSFGEEDDLTERRMKSLAVSSGIKKFSTFAYNPVVGWWFFPYGREITHFLGLNTTHHHKRQSRFGHVIVLVANKPIFKKKHT